MKRIAAACLQMVVAVLLQPMTVNAQFTEGAGDRYFRVAEVGELADSINVWGDVGSAGRYLVPEDTKLPDLISFSLGYAQLQGFESNIDWAKIMIEVKVSRFNRTERMVDVAFFRYRYHDPEPVEMFEFDLVNNDIVTLQVKKRPAFGDYVGIIAPVVGVIATSLLLIENLGGN